MREPESAPMYHGSMKKKPSSRKPPRFYSGADVPMSAIRKFAREVAEKFQPDKIILFGSHAYGTPNADSDVDILVIMDAWNQHSKASRIRSSVHAPFPLDIIVRTPKNLQWRLEEGESFHSEILAKGKVLYEKNDSRVDSQGRGGFSSRIKTRRSASIVS